jgi:hypothetical protein
MSFIQVIEYETTREKEMQELFDEWRTMTEGMRTASHEILARDHARPNHYVAIVEFPSYDEAMRNSSMPETDMVSKRMAELCDGPIRFVDLDVMTDENL